MTQRYVKTDYEGCSYITAGKVYECEHPINLDEWYYLEAWIRCDLDTRRIISLKNKGDLCSHLNEKGTWQWCDKDGNSIGENE